MKTKWYHIAMFFAIVAWAMMCNTDGFSFLKNKDRHWAFFDSTIVITASPKGKLNGEAVFKNLNIIENGKNVFTNNKLIFKTHKDILPICRELRNEDKECLLAFKEKNGDKMLRLQFNSIGINALDTLPLLQFDHRDNDNDGIIEMGGFMHTKLTYCFNCDSVYYNPKLYYEMTDDGFKLDSLATKKWINRYYSDFYGYVPRMDVTVRLLEK